VADINHVYKQRKENDFDLRLHRGFLTLSFRARGHLMFARLSFIVPLAKLLFDFLGDNVNRRVKIGFDIVGKQVGTRKGNPDGARKLPLRRLGLVVFQSDADSCRVLIQMIEFIDPGKEMIFDCLR
jgi:hypothetical protein